MYQNCVTLELAIFLEPVNAIISGSCPNILPMDHCGPELVHNSRTNFLCLEAVVNVWMVEWRNCIEIYLFLLSWHVVFFSNNNGLSIWSNLPCFSMFLMIVVITKNSFIPCDDILSIFSLAFTYFLIHCKFLSNHILIFLIGIIS